jgi:hypothetical protein
MGKRAAYFVDGMVRMLRRVRPQFKRLESGPQHAIASMIWQASGKSREHSKYDGAVFFTFQELEKKFGRGAFLAINERMDLFEVFREDHLQSHTRGYKLRPDIVIAQQNMLKYMRTHRPAIRLLFEDGRYMRSVPEAVASKDMSGITASKWEGAKQILPTPVDIVRLRELLQWLERQIKANTKDLFSAVDVESLRRLEEIAGKILALANLDIEGIGGLVIHHYVEADSGRLYAQNINLQTAPRLIKQTALHGLWEYDIENCHYSIFSQMAQRLGFEAENIKSYLAHKTETRQGIADRMDITFEQAKVCLLAIMYGARASEFHDNAIPDAIGPAAAGRLIKDAVFKGIHDDIKKGRQIILAAQTSSRATIRNAAGKTISDQESAPKRLAHLIQGVEAIILKEVLKLYSSDLVLLQHDGFASKRRLDTSLMEQVIHDNTGYCMKLKEEQISIPPDLNREQL